MRLWPVLLCAFPIFIFLTVFVFSSCFSLKRKWYSVELEEGGGIAEFRLPSLSASIASFTKTDPLFWGIRSRHSPADDAQLGDNILTSYSESEQLDPLAAAAGVRAVPREIV